MAYKFISRIIKQLNVDRQAEWANIEYFDPLWQVRIQSLARLISNNDTHVCDFGCGQEWLKKFLPVGTKYYGVDYLPRSIDTIICDINKRELPPKFTMNGCVFSSGFFEYVEEPEWLVNEWTAVAKTIILSYCAIEDRPKLKTRKSYGWKNHFSSYELICLFLSKGFFLSHLDKINGNILLCFKNGLK